MSIPPLPQPPTPEDVIHIAKLYAESQAYMKSAKEKLQNPPLPTAVDWEISMYILFCAWIVNFGLAPDPPKDPEEASKPQVDPVVPVEYPRQNQHLIEAAATEIGLEWIPFIDLALAPFSSHPNPASGPFGGCFVCKAPKPYMILAFKGTTFPMEVITDTLTAAVKVRAAEGVLYGEQAHKGVGQGMFEIFTYVGETQDAFEIVWDRLHTEARKLQSASDDASAAIPLYVTGHSLGAAYVSLAYIELIRRIGLTTEPTPFILYDAWLFGAPRVVLKDGATRVKGLLQDPVRNVYRPARYRDIVPTLPPGFIYAYRHLDTGYKLDPEDKEGNYVTVRPSEIIDGKQNDPDATWNYHLPDLYYEAIKKVLDTK